jgi:hypothetical protein
MCIATPRDAFEHQHSHVDGHKADGQGEAVVQHVLELAGPLPPWTLTRLCAVLTAGGARCADGAGRHPPPAGAWQGSSKVTVAWGFAMDLATPAHHLTLNAAVPLPAAAVAGGGRAREPHHQACAPGCSGDGCCNQVVGHQWEMVTGEGQVVASALPELRQRILRGAAIAIGYEPKPATAGDCARVVGHVDEAIAAHGLGDVYYTLRLSN